MKATTKRNLIALFGDHEAPQERACIIVGRCARPIPGVLSPKQNNLTDLWVWTDQPNRSTQDVVGHVDLSRPDAMDQLTKLGVRL